MRSGVRPEGVDWDQAAAGVPGVLVAIETEDGTVEGREGACTFATAAAMTCVVIKAAGEGGR